MTEPTQDPNVSADADMSNEEVEALLDRKGAGAGTVSPEGARPYDLAARERIVRGSMPALDRVNERWVGEFEKDVADRVRQPIDVSLTNVQLIPYGEWLTPFPAPSSLNLFAVKPWGGNALIAVDGQLLFGLVEAFYGGRLPSAATQSRSALGLAEGRFNRMLVDALTQQFEAAFQPIAQVEFELLRTEQNPHYASIATPSELVVVSRLDVSLNESGGQLCLIFPMSLLDPVRERLDEQLRAASAETRKLWQDALRDHLASSLLDLKGVFYEGTITMKELLKLKAGDIWPIEMPKTATLRAGGVPLISGKFGRSHGYNAIKVLEAVRGSDARGTRRTR
jgi:flagellar motor switch protein FliM